ncbi:7-cyano-7-deazaguanine synthase domain protein, partial [Yersinia pestis PY-32]
MAFLKS